MAFAADAESPIYLFELSETALTACLVDYRPDGSHRACFLRIDNKAALAALIKGSSSSVIGWFWSTYFGAWKLDARWYCGANTRIRNRTLMTLRLGSAIPRRV